MEKAAFHDPSLEVWCRAVCFPQVKFYSEDASSKSRKRFQLLSMIFKPPRLDPFLGSRKKILNEGLYKKRHVFNSPCEE